MAKKSNKAKKTIKKTSSKKKLSTQKTPASIQGGIYWLLGLLTLVSFVYTRNTPDPAFAIRMVLASGTLLAFLGFYFLKNQLHLEIKHPLVKWFFLLWGGSWLWSIIGGALSINTGEAFLFIGQNFLMLATLIMTILAIPHNRKQLPLLFKGITLIGVVHALAGILQYAGIWEVPPDAVGPYGFSFNRTHFGALLAILAPFSAALIFTSTKVWRIIGGVVLGLETVAILLSQSRSSWVALAGAFIVANFLLFWFKDRFPKRELRLWWGLNIGGVAAFVVALILAVQLNIGGQLLQNTAQRLGSIFGAGAGYSMATSTKNERLQMWEKSLYIIKDNPLFGVGPANWKLEAPPYIKDIPSIAAGDYFLLRPHNTWLQHGGERGIPGLLAHLGAWIVLFMILFRLIKNTQKIEDTIIYFGLAGAITAFAADMMFAFPHEHIDNLFFLALAAGIVIGIFNQEQKEVKGGIKIPRWAFAILVGLLIAVTVNSVMNLRFQQVWYKTFQSAGQNNVQQTLYWGEKTKKYWQNLGPNTDPVQVLTSLVYQNSKQFEKALDEIWEAQAIHPNNYRVYNAMGTIYTEMKRYPEAEKVYLQGLALTPKYRQELKNLALNYYQWGKYAECLKVIENMEIYGDEQLTLLQSEAKRLLGQ